MHFESPDVIRPGTYAFTEVTRAGAHHLNGRLVEVTHEATHKRRLAVTAT